LQAITDADAVISSEVERSQRLAGACRKIGADPSTALGMTEKRRDD
jgi:hypothetical protein